MNTIEFLTFCGVIASFLTVLVAFLGVVVAALAWAIRPDDFKAFIGRVSEKISSRIRRYVFGIVVFTFGATISLLGIYIFVNFVYMTRVKTLYYWVSPNGTNQPDPPRHKGPWIDSRITVKKGDLITFSASGAVTTAIHHLVEDAQRDNSFSSPWVGPEGMYPESTTITLNGRRKDHSLNPHLNYLSLIVRIDDGDANGESENAANLWDAENCYAVVQTSSVTAKKAGDLWFTVNDVWLDKTMKDIYVPDEEASPKYYAMKFQQDGVTPQTQAYREKRWNEYIAKGNWNVWYEDNAGGFLVTINQRSKRFGF